QRCFLSLNSPSTSSLRYRFIPRSRMLCPSFQCVSLSCYSCLLTVILATGLFRFPKALGIKIPATGGPEADTTAGPQPDMSLRDGDLSINNQSTPATRNP